MLSTRPSREFCAAIDELTAGDEVRRNVHHILAEPTGAEKQHLLVFHRGAPVLATTLRRRQHFWEPANATCAARYEVPHRRGHLGEALAASLLEVVVPEWIGDLPRFRQDWKLPFDAYIIDLLHDDLERHWKKSGVERDMRRTYRRAGETEIVADDPQIVTWMLDQWEKNWIGDPSDEVGAAGDLRALFPWLHSRGLLNVVALSHRDNLVAADALAFHGRTAASLIVSRDRDWGYGSSGTVLTAKTVDLLRDRGYERLDLSGYGNYKHRLAPNSEKRNTLHVRPDLPVRTARVVHEVARVWRGLGRRMRSAQANVGLIAPAWWQLGDLQWGLPV